MLGDVAVFGVVVVSRAIQVGGHDAGVLHAVPGTVMAVVKFNGFDTGDLGDSAWIVSRFWCAGEQGVFENGLGPAWGRCNYRPKNSNFLTPFMLQ